ncbi:hypothetical protein HD806DRAFT_503584 [Xylariaceae sp. AK1471]|nr:hypothetical protein HD806DRAFT_503584 [Xylariaceae sp. AK1471]
MCIELYQRWQCCDCWGFIGPQTCPELFKKCLGPRGQIDKKVIRWNEGMCSECWDRFVQEAREMAESEAEAAAEAQRLAAASTSSRKRSRPTPSYSQWSSSTWS